MEVRANFPLSVSGCALDTSPPRGVEEMHELAATSALPRPLQGERCRARKARRRGGTGDSRRSPYAIALPLEGGMSGRTEGGVFALCANA